MEINKELIPVQQFEGVICIIPMSVLKQTAGIGLLAIGGVTAYHRIYKPRKVKKEAEKEI